nr:MULTISPECIES: hypothetical protein [unclassified Nostoc]
MTELLEQAIAKLKNLPVNEQNQDAIAFLYLKSLILYIVSSLDEQIKKISRSLLETTSRSAVSGSLLSIGSFWL